jgi:hypothetical protein
MGNQESTAIVVSDTVNKSISNVLASSSSSCGQNNSLIQEQVFKDIDVGEYCGFNASNISQTAIQSPNFTCASDSKNDSALANQFKNELDQQVKASVSNSTIGNAVANSINKNKTINEISNNISISNVSSCVQDNFLKQSQGFHTIKASCPGYCKNPQLCVGLDPKICDMSLCQVNFNNISQLATQNAVASCLSSNANYQKVLSETANEITQEAKAVNTGVDVSKIVDSTGNAVSGVITSSGDAASGVIMSTAMPFIIIGIVIILVIAISAYFLMSPSKGSNAQMLQNAYGPQQSSQGMFNPSFMSQVPGLMSQASGLMSQAYRR